MEVLKLAPQTEKRGKKMVRGQAQIAFTDEVNGIKNGYFIHISKRGKKYWVLCKERRMNILKIIICENYREIV